MPSTDEKILQKNTNQYSKIKTTIEKILNKLTVEFDEITLSEEASYPVLLIKTNDSGVLIGNNGESLKAFSHIIKRLVEKNLGNSKTVRFLIDINGYHKKRMGTLKNQTRILAERARMFKSTVEMNPMNSYERMLVHSTLADDGDIQTESKGEGKMRRVVLKYKKKE